MELVDLLRRNIPIITFSALFLSYAAVASLPALNVYLVNTSPDFDYRAVSSLLIIEGGEVVSVDGRTIYVSLNQSNMILRYRLKHLNHQLRIAFFDILDVKSVSDGCMVLSRAYRDEVVFEVFLANYCNLTVALRVSAKLIERVVVGEYQVSDMFKLVVVNDTNQPSSGYNSHVVELTPTSIEYEYMSSLKEKIGLPVMIILFFVTILVFDLIFSRLRQ